MGFLGSLIRNGANLIKNIVVPGIKRLAPKIIDGGRRLFNHFNRLPQYINDAKDMYNNGKRIVDNVINTLPDSRVKDKLQDVSNKVDENVQRYTPTINNVANNARDWGNAGNNILNLLNREFGRGRGGIYLPKTSIPTQIPKQQII